MTKLNHEILFIDANVPDAQSLIDGLSSDIEVFLLNDKTNVLNQIAEILDGYQNLDAIHIISHGAEGELAFANGVLNIANVNNYSSQLKRIGSVLSENGDLLLYGCDVAKGDDGLAFINQLSALTGSDVAASENLTGGFGDWLLEQKNGVIESQTITSENYQNELLTLYSISANATIVEGNPITFTVTPSDVVTTLTVLNLNMVGAPFGAITTTTSPSDFTPSSSITFIAGDTAAKTFTVIAVSDGFTEGLEAYKAQLLDSSFNEMAATFGLINDAINTSNNPVNPIGGLIPIESSGSYTLLKDGVGFYFARATGSSVTNAIRDIGGGIWTGGPIVAVDTYLGQKAVVFGIGGGSSANSYHIWLCDETWTKVSSVNISPSEVESQFGISLSSAPGSIPTGSIIIDANGVGSVYQGSNSGMINTLADANGLGVFSYQWLRDGVFINGATQEIYQNQQADVGKALSVKVSYTDGLGKLKSVTSPSVTILNVNDTPTGTVLITGAPTQGQTLTASNTLADTDGLGTINYQWLSNGSVISGATGNNYLLAQTDVGKAISVKASYIDLLGTAESLSSNQTVAVSAKANSLPTGSVTFTGNPIQGQTLVASNS